MKGQELIKPNLGCPEDYDIQWIEGGYLTPSGIDSNDTWSYTDFVPLTSDYILDGVSESIDMATGRYNAFYDENKKIISWFSAIQKFEVEIPKNAKYFRLSKPTVFSFEIHNKIKGIKTVEDEKSNIVYLNKHIEPYIIQSTATKASELGTSLKPLTFIHFSDWHRVSALWKRICEYLNEYKDYIQFALHTGDYCENSQVDYTDAYLLADTKRPILNCVGNHDTYTDASYTKGSQESTYNLLFNHTDNWNVVFGDGSNTMYYYKDFADSEIRLIVLDNYYDIDNQKVWLQNKLNEAKSLGYAVITAMHEVSRPIVNKIQCSFQTLDNHESKGGNASVTQFDTIIKDFKDNGGVHIVNLCGHEHEDMIGFTSNGVLNLVVECATSWNGWTGGHRIKGTKTYDCFNVFSVEKDAGIFKVVRIGDNTDHYLRGKNVLVYDYINKKVISNF